MFLGASVCCGIAPHYAAGVLGCMNKELVLMKKLPVFVAGGFNLVNMKYNFLTVWLNLRI